MILYVLHTLLVVSWWCLCDSMSVLILGDSIDRHIMEDWCNTLHLPIEQFGDFTPNVSIGKIVKYGHQYKMMFKARWNHPFICRNIETQESIASVHIFGSKEEDLVNSPKRIDSALAWYIQQFGYPDRIIFHTTQWDKQRLYETHVCSNDVNVWREHLNIFYKNTHDRLNQISQIVGQKSVIGLRTAVWQNDKCEFGLLDMMNDLIRSIAVDEGMILYDYDRDVHGVLNILGISKYISVSASSQDLIRVKPNFSNLNVTGLNIITTQENNESMNRTQAHFYLFRDWMHPTRFLAFSAGEKLVGSRYSQYMFDFKTQTNINPIPIYIQDLSIFSSVEISILKIIDTNEYFYAKIIRSPIDVPEYIHTNGLNNVYGHLHNSTRIFWKADEADISGLYISHGDMMVVSRYVIESIYAYIPSIDSVPLFFQSLYMNYGIDSKYVGIVSSGGDKYIIDCMRHAHNISDVSIPMLESMGISHTHNNFYVNISNFWITRYLHHAEYSIDGHLFSNGNLLRCHNQKQVYLIENYKRRAIQSLDVFKTRGFDFDQIQIVHICKYFYMISEGDPLR